MRIPRLSSRGGTLTTTPRFLFLWMRNSLLLGSLFLGTMFVLLSWPEHQTSPVASQQVVRSDGLLLRNDFPSLDDTFEMATLSVLMYHFHRETNDKSVCDNINRQNYTIHATPPKNDIVCHYYYHQRDGNGTQVLLASSVKHNYLALVWAGTDDLRTSLTDLNLVTTQFGDDMFELPDKRIKVHAGFNSYVFGEGLFQDLIHRLEVERENRPDARLFTTGHSLGASSSILTAVGLTLHYTQSKLEPPNITCINFGCPQMGNSYWNDFVNNNALIENVSIWRLVLGWDLVPRLPKLFYHSGHTIQLSRGKDWIGAVDPDNYTAEAYYLHDGDWNIGYAGVPFGWSSLPFIWVPGSLFSHAAHRYWEYLDDWMSSSTKHRLGWVKNFVRIDNSSAMDDDGPLVNVDDDFYVDPPDDDIDARMSYKDSALMKKQ